ncbi:MAG: hypothetical protein ABI720_08135 [Actinomycetes bacterium]
MTLDHDAVRSHVVQNMLAAGGGASHAQMMAWGVSRLDLSRLLRSGVICRSRREHFVLPWGGENSDHWQRTRSMHLRVAAAAAVRESPVGLRSAALMWRLPVWQIPRRVELIRPPGSGPWKGLRVVRRLLSAGDVTAINGVPVTTLERTAVDIALDVPTPKALITVDAALRRGASRETMAGILTRMGSVRGCREARRTLDWADGNSESPLESRGRGELMLLGVVQPLSNVSVRLGDIEFRADHWWMGLGVAGEADGEGKYGKRPGEEETLWAEKLRQEWFEEELGLYVVRYVDREIRLAPQRVADRLQRKVDRRRRDPWEPPPGLEVFQRPHPGSDAPIRWLLRRDEG